MPTTRLLSRIGPLRCKKLSICPNAGYPTVIDRQMVFPTTPTYFENRCRRFRIRCQSGRWLLKRRPFISRTVSSSCRILSKKSKRNRVDNQRWWNTANDEGADNQATAKGESRYGDKSSSHDFRRQHTNGLTTVQPIDHNPILQRMTQGQKLIAVEYDSPPRPTFRLILPERLHRSCRGECTDHR